MTGPFTTPAIMSAPMVRALLDGCKTQTRRLVTSQWANLKMHFDAGERCLVWVRESFSERIKPEEATDGLGRPWYKTDSEWSGEIKWKPSIHMPRWASRLTLEVTDVRLQRLQDISEQDAIEEGCGHYTSQTVLHWPFDPNDKGNYRAGFRELWASLHGTVSWDVDPPVITISFRVHQQNIDALLALRGES